MFSLFLDQNRNAKQLLQDSLHNVQDIKGNKTDQLKYLSVFLVPVINVKRLRVGAGHSGGFSNE